MACGEEEQREVIPYEEPAEEEEIDMEQFRVEGDRLSDEPVLSTEERQLRFIEQYERIDRPIIMNTIRHIRDFDVKHEGTFEGVRLITGKGVKEVQDEMLETYRGHLGEPLNENTTQIYDIGIVYPYTEDDFKSYYETVVNILQDEVLGRVQTYETISNNLDKRDFQGLRRSGVVANLQGIVDEEGGMLEQIRPYIEAMDEIVVNLRLENGLEMPKYSQVEVDVENIEDEIEEVEEYVTPEPTTVQEINSIEPTSGIYDRNTGEVEEETDNSGEGEADEGEEQETQTGEEVGE